ncbi:MAG: hypothetical protein IKV60_02930 [Rikenellaceae bacterium]|nr:hypothetical protein [Rikenellaceae bacterium]
MVLFVTFFFFIRSFGRPKEPKSGRKPPERETSFLYILLVCFDAGYAVGILPNICACDLTSELAGHNHKRYLYSPSGIKPSSKHRGTNILQTHAFAAVR